MKRGNITGHLVDLRKGHIEHRGDSFDHRLAAKARKGRNLTDPISAVLFGDVLDHLAAPLLAEVDVEVGHRDALWVEEALKQEVIRQRVEVGDAQRPCDQGASP